MAIRKAIYLSDPAGPLWEKLWPLFGSPTESGALYRLLQTTEADLFRKLDAEGLQQYRADTLTRIEMLESFRRRREGKKANGPQMAPLDAAE